MSRTTFHPFDGGKPVSAWCSSPFPFRALVESLAACDMPYTFDWGRADYDRDFLDECSRYDLVEMYCGDEEYIEVVTYDGDPIGVLDNNSIGEADLARFETVEQIERREGAEDAARELHADVRRELAGEAR